jgi:hypothetical protein
VLPRHCLFEQGIYSSLKEVLKQIESMFSVQFVFSTYHHFWVPKYYFHIFFLSGWIWHWTLFVTLHKRTLSVTGYNNWHILECTNYLISEHSPSFSKDKMTIPHYSYKVFYNSESNLIYNFFIDSYNNYIELRGQILLFNFTDKDAKTNQYYNFSSSYYEN